MVELGRRAGLVGRKGQNAAQDIELALGYSRARALGIACRLMAKRTASRCDGAEMGRESVGVLGDVGALIHWARELIMSTRQSSFSARGQITPASRSGDRHPKRRRRAHPGRRDGRVGERGLVAHDASASAASVRSSEFIRGTLANIGSSIPAGPKKPSTIVKPLVTSSGSKETGDFTLRVPLWSPSSCAFPELPRIWHRGAPGKLLGRAVVLVLATATTKVGIEKACSNGSMSASYRAPGPRPSRSTVMVS